MYNKYPREICKMRFKKCRGRKVLKALYMCIICPSVWFKTPGFGLQVLLDKMLFPHQATEEKLVMATTDWWKIFGILLHTLRDLSFLKK